MVRMVNSYYEKINRHAYSKETLDIVVTENKDDLDLDPRAIPSGTEEL